MAERLEIGARRRAVARLEELEHELARLATWLTGLGADRAAILLECAARDAGAAGWELDRPLRRPRLDASQPLAGPPAGDTPPAW